jgi:hypothetical protein
VGAWAGDGSRSRLVALGGALVVCALVVPALWVVTLSMRHAARSEPELSSAVAMPDPMSAAPAGSGSRLVPQPSEPQPPSRAAPSVTHVLSPRMRRTLRMAISQQLLAGAEPLRRRLEQCPDPPPRGDRGPAANPMLVAWMQAPRDEGARDGHPS